MYINTKIDIAYIVIVCDIQLIDTYIMERGVIYIYISLYIYIYS